MVVILAEAGMSLYEVPYPVCKVLIQSWSCWALYLSDYDSIVVKQLVSLVKGSNQY